MTAGLPTGSPHKAGMTLERVGHTNNANQSPDIYAIISVNFVR
jgi:hypothetical protein